MTKRLALIAFLAGPAFLPPPDLVHAAGPADAIERPVWVADEVLIRMKQIRPEEPSIPLSERLQRFSSRHAIARVEEIRDKRKPADHDRRVIKATLPQHEDITRKLETLRLDPEIEWAEPNYYRYFDAIPNDAYYGSQAAGFTAIGAPAAWDITTGGREVVVAVVDSGVAWSHPDLAANIWINPGEIAGDGIDNDANGFIDDIRGWDFVSVSTSAVSPGEDPGPPDNDPSDFIGHGTHVTGIIGAVGDNGEGVTGVAWQVSIMPARAGYVDRNGHGLLTDAAISEAMHYACDNGADIVNMSFSSTSPSNTLQEAIAYCAAQGILMVASAGNEGSAATTYPAAYEPVIAVTSLNDSNVLSSFASHGSWVDLAARGESILSTLPPSSHGVRSGTSMAAPMVSGVAALIKARYPGWSSSTIRQKLIATAQDISAANPGKNGMLGSGLVRADEAVTVCTDADSDGYTLEGKLCGPADCNDSDPTINPAAADNAADGVDQNCDGFDGPRPTHFVHFPAVKDGPHSDGEWFNYLSISAMDRSSPVNVTFRLYASDGALKHLSTDVTPVNGTLITTPNWLMHQALSTEAFDGAVSVEAEAPIFGMINTIAPREAAYATYESPTPRASLFFPSAYDNYNATTKTGYQNILHLQNIHPEPVAVTVEYIDDYNGAVTDYQLIPSHGEYERNIRQAFGQGFNGVIKVTAGDTLAGMLRYEYLTSGAVTSTTIYEATVERTGIHLPFIHDGFGGNYNFYAVMNTSATPATCRFDFYPADGDTGSGPAFSDRPSLIQPGERYTTTPSWARCGNFACSFDGAMTGGCDQPVTALTNVITPVSTGYSDYEATEPKNTLVFPQVYDAVNGYENELHLQNVNAFPVTVDLTLFLYDGSELGASTVTIPPFGKHVMRPSAINAFIASRETNGSITAQVADGKLITGVMAFRKPAFMDIYEAVAR